MVEILVNIGSGNDQVITWANEDLSSKKSCSIYLSSISQEMLKILTHLTPGQNGHQYADDIFKRFFLNLDSIFTEICS